MSENMQHVVSTKTLIQSTIGALAFAILVFVIIILPAEYNIDPTGVGTKLGLSVLAGSDDTNAVNKSAVKENADSKVTNQKQLIEVTVPAMRGVEYKFHVKQHDKMKYEWKTDGAALYFDLHGEPEGDKTGYFESYAIATLSEMKGSFTAPFTGSHGWYWKNESYKPVVIQLMVEGQYSVIGLKQ